MIKFETARIHFLGDVFGAQGRIQKNPAGFFLRGGTPLRNGLTDWWRTQILKANTKKKAFD